MSEELLKKSAVQIAKDAFNAAVAKLGVGAELDPENDTAAVSGKGIGDYVNLRNVVYSPFDSSGKVIEFPNESTVRLTGNSFLHNFETGKWIAFEVADELTFEFTGFQFLVYDTTVSPSTTLSTSIRYDTSTNNPLSVISDADLDPNKHIVLLRHTTAGKISDGTGLASGFYKRWDYVNLRSVVFSPFSGGNKTINFPDKSTFKVTSNVYFHNHENGRYLRLDVGSTLTFEFTTNQFLVFDTTVEPSSVGSVSDNYDTSTNNPLIIVSDTELDPNEHIVVLRHINAYGFAEGVGLAGGLYLDSKVVDKRNLKGLVFSPYAGGTNLTISFPNKSTVKLTGNSYLHNHQVGRYFAFEVTDDVEFNFTAQQWLVHDTSVTPSTVTSTSDRFDLATNNPIKVVSDTELDPNIHVILLRHGSGYGFIEGVGLAGGIYEHLSQSELKNQPAIADNAELAAHGGLIQLAPYNTREGAVKASQYGYKYMEFDLHKCSTGEYVVTHDATVDAYSDGTGTVADMTLAELKALDFSDGNSAYTGTRIPTLQELFATLKKVDMLPFCEFKVDFSSSEIDEIVSIHREYFPDDAVIYQTFDLTTALATKNACPNATVLHLWTTWTEAKYNSVINTDLDGVAGRFTDLDQAILNDLITAGKKVATWTVLDSTIQSAKLYPFTWIITDGAFNKFESTNPKVIKKSGIDWSEFTLNGNTASSYILEVTGSEVYIDIPASEGDVVKVVMDSYGDASAVCNIVPYNSGSRGTVYSVDVSGDEFDSQSIIKCLYETCDSVRIEFKRTAGSLFARQARIEVFEM